MTPASPRHARIEWTGSQRVLAVALVILGLGLTVVTFTMIYFTVTHLLHPYMGDWSWTVVAAGEAAFTFLFLTGILLALRKAPAGALRSLLMMGLFCGSVLLNVYASRHSLPDAAGHILIVVTFFGCLLTGKSTLLRLLGGKVRADRITFGEWVAHPVHSLRLSRWMVTWGEPSRERAHARYMALLFAIAVVQADPAVGRAPFTWRRRLPVTLRYQLATGQFPPVVQSVIDGPGADWQAAVTAHVREQLALPSREQSDRQSDDRHAGRQQDRQNDRQKNRQDTAADRRQRAAKVRRILTATPDMPLADVAVKAGVSESTVTRIKREMPTPLRRAQ